jgi:hypothetical protein
MTTFNFDRNGAKSLRMALDAHLAALSAEMGLTIKVTGAIVFDERGKEIKFKVSATAGEESDRAKFAILAPLYGLDAEDFGKPIKGDTVSGITNTGRLMVARGTETRLYPVKALPSLVLMLHPGDAKRARTARIATGHATAADYAAPSTSTLTEVPAPFTKEA